MAGHPQPVDDAQLDSPSAFSLSREEWDKCRLWEFLAHLQRHGIQAQKTDGHAFPPEALMHDRGAVVPMLVVSPRSEWGVAETLRLLKAFDLYDKLPVSVKSGGHGYFNGASCSGIMINLAGMTDKRIVGDTLYVEPGCILGRLIDTLAAHGKAVPHGDCFGVGAGGHFLTAGWDIALARRYGLGCQSVTGGRIVLWDGSAVEVDESSTPELLYAMRGGAAAGAGVVTEVRLRLVDQPPSVTWRFTRLSEEQLKICVDHHAFSRAATLPRDISVSFRFHFEPSQPEPDRPELVCSFNVVSLLSANEAVRCLSECLGAEVASLVADLSGWSEKSLVDLRMLPAADALAANPQMLSEMTSQKLHEDPLAYWKPTVSAREMAPSFFTSVSHWVVPECESMFLELYDAFHSARDREACKRMYALVIQGGGRMTELQRECAMPLGQALARFELHWDDPGEEQWSRSFTDKVSRIMQSKGDPAPGRPYRGDIWLEEQGRDARLDGISAKYDRRLG